MYTRRPFGLVLLLALLAAVPLGCSSEPRSGTESSPTNAAERGAPIVSLPTENSNAVPDQWSPPPPLPPPPPDQPQWQPLPEVATQEELEERYLLISAAAFSPDGKRLVTGYTALPYLTVWDLDGGKPPRRLDIVPSGFTANVGFLADGRRLIVSEVNGFLTLYDLEEGRTVWRKRAFGDRGVALLAAGGRVALAIGRVRPPLNREPLDDPPGLSDQCQLWDVEKGEVLRAYPFPKGCGGPYALSAEGSLALWLDKGRLAKGGLGTYAVVRQADTGLVVRGFPDEAASQVYPLPQLSPDGQRVLFMRIENSPAPNKPGRRRWVWWLSLRDVNTGRQLVGFPTEPSEEFNHPGLRLAVRFAPDGRGIITANGNVVQSWDVRGTKIGEVKLDPVPDFKQPDEGHPVVISPDGSRLFAGTEKATPLRGSVHVVGRWFSQLPVQVWDLRTGKRVFSQKHPGERGDLRSGPVLPDVPRTP